MTLLDFLHELGFIITPEELNRLAEVQIDLLNQLNDLFKNPILQLDYTNTNQWHLGIIPQSFKGLSADDGRELVTAKIRKYVPNFILIGNEDKTIPGFQRADLSIHIQKLPSFIPKESDKGIHITVGMNDTYLPKGGQNYDELRVQSLSLLATPIALQENPFILEKFGFINGNENNMEMCNGRTGFAVFLAKKATQIVTKLRAQYQTTDSGRYPHITLAYLSVKTPHHEMGNQVTKTWNHELWNSTFCPKGEKFAQTDLACFYLNPKFRTHPVLPFLVPGLFEKIQTAEQALKLKELLLNFKL